ncbi:MULTISPECIES: hypothetical protein [unclassified Streptomyces]|uniref:hypothetical protein n=1 Tax=unclassified Streptomyces TaxID=2593676 RepID=UPI00368A3589
MASKVREHDWVTPKNVEHLPAAGNRRASARIDEGEEVLRLESGDDGDPAHRGA